jgi:hypothetical protein
MKKEVKQTRSCWDCAYYKIPALELVGNCHWFPEHGKGEAKSLLQSKDRMQVDKGCRFFIPADEYGS